MSEGVLNVSIMTTIRLYWLLIRAIQFSSTTPTRARAFAG
jgi:hypothetical protein